MKAYLRCSYNNDAYIILYNIYYNRYITFYIIVYIFIILIERNNIKYNLNYIPKHL